VVAGIASLGSQFARLFVLECERAGIQGLGRHLRIWDRDKEERWPGGKHGPRKTRAVAPTPTRANRIQLTAAQREGGVTETFAEGNPGFQIIPKSEQSV
jgi:hypothetical protein